MSFLAKQLDTAKDPRLKVNAATTLGKTGNPTASDPLCRALRDAEAIVRAAAANALGELRTPTGVKCLTAAQGDSDGSVKSAVARALAAGAVAPGTLYVNIQPIGDKGANLPPDMVALADRLLRDKFKTLNAGVAPPNEEKKAAQNLVRSRQLKGFQVQVNLLPHGAGLKVEMLVMTYPEQELKGTFSVKASGAKHEALLKAMVPRVVDDASKDPELAWK